MSEHGGNGSEEISNDSGDGTWPLSEPVLVRIDELLPARSPRLNGEDLAHARMLAEADSTLPPIIVNGRTMRVVDGMHRVHAARMHGREEIEARLFDGDDATAFILAVEANVRHGLPLSQADREAAARQILLSHPEWSDRVIAASVGLAWKTVGAVRRRSGVAAMQPTSRIGRDGRTRPVDGTAGRLRASSVLASRPDASLREIASAAGISIGTARDVRERVQRGEDPVPAQLRRSATAARPAPRGGGRVQVTDVVGTLERLKRDPSLRLTESGRVLLRWLDGRVITDDDFAKVVKSIPPHCVDVVEAIARRCAQSWMELASLLREDGTAAH